MSTFTPLQLAFGMPGPFEWTIILGIGLPLRNFAVLGKVLAAILASISEHLGLKNELKTIVRGTRKPHPKQFPKHISTTPK